MRSCSVPRVLKKIAYGAGLVIVVLLATLAGQYLFVLATGTRFNETQWAAAGAWFGGIMTFGAVSVALGQTWLTKTKADQDIANLKAQGVTDRLRHKVELAKADERLAQQLDAVRRSEQIQAIAPIVGELSSFVAATHYLVVTLQACHYRPIPENLSDRDRAEVQWDAVSAQTHAAIARALMVVQEPHCYTAIEDAFRSFLRVKKEVRESVRASPGKKSAYEDLQVLVDAANRHRAPLTRAVRTYLHPPRADEPLIDPNQLRIDYTVGGEDPLKA